MRAGAAMLRRRSSRGPSDDGKQPEPTAEDPAIAPAPEPATEGPAAAPAVAPEKKGTLEDLVREHLRVEADFRSLTGLLRKAKGAVRNAMIVVHRCSRQTSVLELLARPDAISAGLVSSTLRVKLLELLADAAIATDEDKRPTVGNHVKIVDGPVATIVQDDHDSQPYRVKPLNGETLDRYFTRSEVVNLSTDGVEAVRDYESNTQPC